MPLQVDYALAVGEDGTITLSLSTPVGIGGMNIEFVVMPRFDGEPFITKSMASGFYGVSGMNIVESGEGIMRVNLYETEFSGRPYGNYASQWRRLDSGYHKIISEGYILRTP